MTILTRFLGSIIISLALVGSAYSATDFAMEYPNGTPLEVYTPNNPPPSNPPGGSDTQVQYNDGGSFGGDSNLIWKKSTDRLGVQATDPQVPLHVASVTGTTIDDVSSGSVSLVSETLPSAPTGSITQIGMPSAGSGGSLSFSNAGSGGFSLNDGDSVEIIVIPCLLANGTYYESQNAETISNTVSGSDNYDLSGTAGTVTISGETTYYKYQYQVNGGGYNDLGITSSPTFYFSSTNSASASNWPTFYTAGGGTAPTPFDSGYAQATNVGMGGISETGYTIYVEVDSVTNIGGTDYVSGTPTGGSFSDSGLVQYDAEVSWNDPGGSQTNAITRISVDGGSTWYYQYVGSTTSPYTWTSLSNDSAAEARWGQTYGGGGSVVYTFKPYGVGLAPSSNPLYSTVGSDYSTTISDSNYYILKHSFSGSSTGVKILDSTFTYGYLQSGSLGDYYDTGYTSWGSGSTVTPNSYGFSGTAQNRDYRLYSYNSGLGIYSVTPLTLSTTAGSGSKYVSGSFSYPSGTTIVKILRQVNGGGYVVSKTINSPTTTFTDDSTDGTWNGNTTITPNSITPGTARLDSYSDSVSDQPALSIVDITNSGTRYPKISFGVATSSSATPTFQSHIHSTSSTGYLSLVTSRLEIPSTLGGTAAVMLGNANVFNNANSGSVHFQVKGQNDSSLINTRSDQDTVGFGQALGTDGQTTVQIQPARSSDLGLVMKGHASQSTTSNLIRFQSSAGSYYGYITLGGHFVAGGNVSNPGHSFYSDTDTGMYNVSANVLGFATGGTTRGNISSSGLSLSNLTSGRVPVIGTSGLLTDDSAFLFNTTTNMITASGLTADGSGGLLIEASGGTDIGQLGSAGTANVTWYGSHNFNAATASTIASFGSSKTLESLSTSTYPSLTELSYVKGVTSAIQTQLGTKFSTSNSPTVLNLPYLKYSNTQTSGTGGGTSTSGSFQPFFLNTEDFDTAGIGSLSSNQISLPAGTYQVRANGQLNCNVACYASSRLYNISDSSVILLGQTAEVIPTGTALYTNVVGQFTIASTKTIEFQYRVSAGYTTYGQGINGSFQNEVYTQIEFWKIS